MTIFEILSICAICLSLFGCTSGVPTENSGETAAVIEDAASNFVRSNPAAIGYSLEETVENAPFTSYTYDFTVYEDNFMITATPDETRTGLVLTVENNNFEYYTFNVSPPAGYSVYLPYSQQEANTVCTVIRGTENVLPDLLKIDFYRTSSENENLPYTVSRMYTIIPRKNGELVQLNVFGKPAETSEADEYATMTLALPLTIEAEEPKEESGGLAALDYIPESSIYQAEPLNPRKFMADPEVTANDDGSFDVSVVTYEFDEMSMSMTYKEEECTRENPIYFGYAAYAIAGDIYKYFKDTSLNVSDYENYVEIPSASGDTSQYFFKVDDPRFSTVKELRQFAEKYFAKNIVDEMFLSAPQQYRDIDGELYTIVGDGGHDDSLGRLIFTGEMEEDLDSPTDNLTYYTQQEKYNENHEMTGYIDGGKFTLEFTDSEPGFIITQYRYPN